MNAPGVPCLWSPPDQKSLRTAIARCLHLLMREHGVTLGELAHAAECNAETVRLAYRRESTFNHESWLKLRFWFRESAVCFEPYDQLWNPDCVTVGPQSPEERLNVIQRELEEVRKAVRRKEEV